MLHQQMKPSTTGGSSWLHLHSLLMLCVLGSSGCMYCVTVQMELLQQTAARQGGSNLLQEPDE